VHYDAQRHAALAMALMPLPLSSTNSDLSRQCSAAILGDIGIDSPSQEGQRMECGTIGARQGNIWLRACPAVALLHGEDAHG